MVRLLYVVTVLILTVYGPAMAQQSNRPVGLGPDFSGLEPGPNIAGKLSEKEAAALAALETLDASLAGAIRNQIVNAETYHERIRLTSVQALQFGNTVDLTEKLYVSGQQTGAKLDEVLAVREALSQLARVELLSADHKSIVSDTFIRMREWTDRANKSRDRRRHALGLHPQIGKTPGPNDQRQMTDVCSYVHNGPAAGWKNIKQACYALWSIGACPFVVPMTYNVAKCRNTLQDAKHADKRGQMIWDFCALLPAAKQPLCYQHRGTIRVTCTQFQQFDNEKVDKCLHATRDMPNTARN